MIQKSPHPTSVRVAIVGAGGNIGSHAVPLVARTPEVATIVLIDPDTYSVKNVSGQNISASEVGFPKVAVQAERIREINPDLTVEAWQEAVETVPWMILDVDVILACLDSRRARQGVGLIATRLGVPWIDAGVDAGFAMARVSTFIPSLVDGPCVECGWGRRDYELMEQLHACGAAVEVHATNADASLGSLAASLQVIELQKLLRDPGETTVEAVLSTKNMSLRRASTGRNPDCRFPDHSVWSFDTLDTDVAELALGDIRASSDPAGEASLSEGPFLEVEGSSFVERAWCPSCGGNESTLALDRYLRRLPRECSTCGEAMTYRGAEMRERIDLSALDRESQDTSMESIGFRPGDLFSVDGPNGVHHYAFPNGVAREEVSKS